MYGAQNSWYLDENVSRDHRVAHRGGNPVRRRCQRAVRHDIYTNRGVIGSQAYAREFENAAPIPTIRLRPEMKWLSRGLFEGLLSFISLGGEMSTSTSGGLLRVPLPTGRQCLRQAGGGGGRREDRL